MQIVKRFGLVLMAICACSAVGAVAASAHMFTSTGTGTLILLRHGTQKFVTKFGTVECTGLAIKSTISATLTEDIHATAEYTKCFLGIAEVKITPALYLFLASGLVHISNSIVITGVGCTLTVKPQLVWTTKYINTGKEVEIKPEVKNIAYEGTGSTCNGSGTEGTYEGTSVVGLAGQTVKWE